MTIRYPDVSNWNAGLSLSGAAAAVAKASQGTGYRDPYFAGFRAQAANLGVPFAGYHWLDTTDAAAQARNAFAVVGAGTPLMIDDEQPPISVGHTLAFVAAYRQLGGTVTMEYLPQWVWSRSGSPDLRPLATAGLSLVSSNYTTYSDTGPGWTAYGGVTPTIWQYTDAQPFNGRSVDFNAFKGTIEQLRAVFAGRGGSMTGEADKAFSATYTGTEPWINGQSWMAKAVEKPLRDLGAKLASLAVDVAALKAAAGQPATVAVDTAQLAAALADPAFLAAIRDAAETGGETAVRTVLGSLDHA